MELRCFKLLLWKRYFDTGYGITSYAKYIVAMIGVGEVVKGNITTLLIIGLAYAAICFLIGWAYIYFKLIETDLEIRKNHL